MTNNPIPIVPSPQPGPTPAMSQPPQKPKKNKALIPVAIIVVLIIVAAGGYLGFKKTNIGGAIGGGTFLQKADPAMVSFRVTPTRAAKITENYQKVLSGDLSNIEGFEDVSNFDSARYALAQLNSDSEPELLIAVNNSKGETRLNAYQPGRMTYNSNDEIIQETDITFKGGAIWQNTDPDRLLSSARMPRANSGSIGLWFPTEPMYDSDHDRVFGKYFSGDSSEPTSSGPISIDDENDNIKVDSTDYDPKLKLEHSSVNDLSLLTRFKEAMEQPYPVSKDKNLESLWRYQLVHFDELEIPKGKLDGYKGQKSSWKSLAYRILDINNDDYPELIVVVKETNGDAFCWGQIIFSYDPKTQESYFTVSEPDHALNENDPATPSNNGSVYWEGPNEWGMVLKTTRESADKYELWKLEDKELVRTNVTTFRSYSSSSSNDTTDSKLQVTENNSTSAIDVITGFKGLRLDSLPVKQSISKVKYSGKEKSKDSKHNWEEEYLNAKANELSFFHGTVHIVSWDEALKLAPESEKLSGDNDKYRPANADSKTFAMLISEDNQVVDFYPNVAGPDVTGNEKSTDSFQVAYIEKPEEIERLKAYDGKEIGLTFDHRSARIPQGLGVLPTRGLHLFKIQDVIN